MTALPRTSRDEVRFYRADGLGGVEAVSAHFRHRSFPAHAHEEYVFGAMTAGSEILSIRGNETMIDCRHVILISPGEVHSNRGANDDPFGYAVIYAPTDVVAEALRESAACNNNAFLRFQAPAPTDSRLRAALLSTHAVLTGGNAPLEQESALLIFLKCLFLAQKVECAERSIFERRAVQCARDYLEEQFRDNFSLTHLAAVAGVSRFHLVRSFKNQLGLTPAAYNLQLRIAEAKRLIRSGYPLADAAAELGFSDQSHLSRHFQRFVGTSPGRYAEQYRPIPKAA